VVDIEAYAILDTALPEYRLTITHAPVSTGSVYQKPKPLLQAITRETVVLAPRTTVVLDNGSANISRSRQLTQKQLASATKAVLRLDVFDVNGGRYDRKYLYINGIQAGKLPVSPEPITEWHECDITLNGEVRAGLKLDTAIGLMDKTGDSYKIRNMRLEVTLPDGSVVTSRSRPGVFSSDVQWKHAEGAALALDGTPVTTLSF
jgi:hypothetical protein